MSTLDRYIARQYLTNVAALIVILFSFVVAIDVSLNFDEFLKIAKEHGKPPRDTADPSMIRTGVVAAGLVLDLWWPRLLQLLNALFGLVMVGGMGFTLSQMVRQRELVAMLAGGISLWRAARPVYVCAAALCLLQLANQEYLIPRIAPLLTRQLQQAGERTLGAAALHPTTDDSGRVFLAQSFDADHGILRDLQVIERDAAGHGTRLITALSARWSESEWLLEQGRVKPFGVSAPPEPLAALRTNLDPTTLKLRRFSSYKSSLSFGQATEMLARRELDVGSGVGAGDTQGRTDELERIRLGRFGAIACNMLALAVCMPFFMRREPVGMVVPALKSAPLAVAALMGGVVAASDAIPALPPTLSVFVPAIVLLPIAIASVTSVRS
ncbi:LptF/LptG family permease [bacterium]|nr:MAG: LptF/LptG family permease [bacterium]